MPQELRKLGRLYWLDDDGNEHPDDELYVITPIYMEVDQIVQPGILGWATVPKSQWDNADTDCGEPTDDGTIKPPTDVTTGRYASLIAVRINRDPGNGKGGMACYTFPPETICEFILIKPAGTPNIQNVTVINPGATDNFKQYQALGDMPVGTYTLYIRPKGATSWIKIVFTITANYNAVVYQTDENAPVTGLFKGLWRKRKKVTTPQTVINFVGTEPQGYGTTEVCNASGYCRMKLVALDNQTEFISEWLACKLIGGTISSGTWEGRHYPGLPPGRYRSIAAPIGIDDESTWKSKDITIGAAPCTRPTGLTTYKLVTGVTVNNVPRNFTDHSDACITVQNALADQSATRPTFNTVTVQLASLADGQTVYVGGGTDCTKQAAGYGYLFGNDNTDLHLTIRIDAAGTMEGEETNCFYSPPNSNLSKILAVDWWTIDTGADDTFLIKTSKLGGLEMDFKFDQETSWQGYRNVGQTIDPSGLGYQYAYAIAPQPVATTYLVRFRTKDNPSDVIQFRFTRPNPQVRTNLYLAP